MKIENKTIWITGASSGIGKALAIEMSKYNTSLILSSITDNELIEVTKTCKKNGAKCFPIAFDLESPESINNAIEKVFEVHSKIDILVNNGGISQRAFAVDTDFSVDRKIMEINYFAAVNLTKAVLPKMVAQKSGHLVAVSSISGKFGFPLRSAYAASKFAIVGFFETLYFELKQHNINVSMIFPGRVNTNISKNALLKDGSTHGKMDDGQAGGISAEKCAKQMIMAIQKNRKETLIGGKELFMVHIRRFFPSIFNKIVNKIKPT
ncbi:MAG: SDR family oxidoreductase [Bacteroidales bacterium]|nr:SDR family oxidoreductase [Bacteroidales bacterium]